MLIRKIKKRHNFWSKNTSVAEQHHFYAAPVKNFDAIPASSPTLPTFLKHAQFNVRFGTIFASGIFLN
jgi:hypothetical protein